MKNGCNKIIQKIIYAKHNGCEDSLNDQSYFNKVYQEACELTAYLCTLYNLDPKGTVAYNGVKVPVILCHQDSYQLKLGNNHGDVYHWFKKFGKTMDDVRNDVANLMGKKSEVVIQPVKPSTPTTSVEIKIGDTVRLAPDAKYVSGKSIPSWVFKSTLYVRDIRNNGDVVISTLKTGAVTGVVSPKYILKDGQAVNTKPDASTFTPYKVKVTVDDLNIRSGPGTEYKIVGCIKDHGTYTIVEESNNWGHLKSGAGWIHLGYTKKV